MPASRNGAVDGIKTIAILGTILIHASALGILSDDVGSLHWTLSLGWASLLRCAVPLFLMCSGALFLPAEKTLTIRSLWTKYIPRIAVALAFWALFYALWDRRNWGEAPAVRWKNALMEWGSCHHKYHLYYLVILLALYALLPLLRLLAQKGSDDLLRYAMVLWLVSGSLLPVLFALPPLTYVSGYFRQYGLPLTLSGPGYALAGYLLLRGRRRPPWVWLLLYLAGLAVTFLCTLAFSLRDGTLSEMWLSGTAPGVTLQAVGIFGLGSSLWKGRPPSRLTETVSRASFCIYLIHPLFLDLLEERDISSASLHGLWAAPMLSVLLLLAGLACWLVLRKVPVVNRYLI